MIVFIILWLFLLLISTPIGLNILQLARAEQFDRSGDRLIISIWLGLAILSLCLLIASMRFPLSPALMIVIAVGLNAFSLLRRAVRRELFALGRQVKPGWAIGFTGLMLGVAFYSMQPVRYFDTGVYHFGVVRWLSRFGAVTGMALMQVRFGAASSWFALWAPFNHGFLDARVTMLLNGLALLLVLFQALLCLGRCLAKRARLTDWFVLSACAFLIPCGIYWKTFVSMAPDVAVVVLTVIVSWAVVTVSDGPEIKQSRWIPDASIIPFILAASALTDKLSAFCLFALTGLFCLYRSRRNLLSIIYACVIGVIFVLPMLIYQTITSGCPFLPTSLMCLNVPWSIGTERANSLTRAIATWSQWGGAPPPDGGRWDWLWRGWFSLGTTNRTVMAVLFATAIAAAAWIVMRLLKTRPGILVWVLRLGIAVAALGLMFRAMNLLFVYLIVFGLLTFKDRFPAKPFVLSIGLLGVILGIAAAPSFRYNFGYMTVLAACIIVSHRAALGRVLQQLVNVVPAFGSQRSLVALFIVAGLVVSLARVLVTNNPPTNSPFASAEETSIPILIPPHFPVAVVVPQRVNNLDYYAPVEGQQCFAAELPCAEGILDPETKLRNPNRGLAAGFEYTGKNSAETRK